MMLANLADNRVTASPGAKGATCPGCATPVVAKCGTIKVWHWAHTAADCDPWAEPMTAWHLGWQELVPEDRRDVVIGNHRADMLTTRGLVVEVQHSRISEAEILEREAHYGQMVWIFDVIWAATEPWPEGDHPPRLDIRTPEHGVEPTYRTFRWRHAWSSIAACRQPVYLDLGGDELLLLGRFYHEAPTGGWGHIWTRDEVAEHMNAPA